MSWIKLSIAASVFLVILLLVYGLAVAPNSDSGHDYAVLISFEDGQNMAEFYRERRFFVPHTSVPPHVKDAFIAIEDKRFYSHYGIDLKGIMRALRRDISSRAVVEGGSTITQQVAKMVLKDPERSITRKIREMFVTARLEWKYTKDEILGMYLNLAYFGERVYGIESAARTYFDKSTPELTISEAALLAALQKAPNKYSPLKDPLRAKARRKIVLSEMLGDDVITEEEYSKALDEPLPKKVFFERRCNAPYFVEYAKRQLTRKYGDDMLNSRGFRVRSTIDAKMQELAEKAVLNGVRAIEERSGKGVQAALVAMDLESGAIRAMVGGTDFRKSQFNRATMALRQPGSAFKPFVYMAAMEQGKSCDDRILDAPVSIPDPDGGMWSPKNSEWIYYGSVPIKTALALSLNTATVRLSQEVGIEKVQEAAVRCGIRSALKDRPSLALGASEVTLLELTSAYIPFANGKRTEPVAYTEVADRNGVVVENVAPVFYEAVSPETVGKMRLLLRGVVESGIAGMARGVNRPVYGKTGTSDDNSDAWFIGFDDRLVVGVWVGRDDHKVIGYMETGSEAALPIWTEFMKKVNRH